MNYPRGVEEAIEALADFGVDMPSNAAAVCLDAYLDAQQTDDLRLDTDLDAQKALQMIQGAFMSGGIAAYAVEHRGKKMTAFAWMRSDTDAVPLGLLLSEEEWENSPHLSADHRATKDDGANS